MGGKTNGSKERGVGETVAKESGGEETIVKAMGVRETGGKVSGGKATGAQVSQETGGKGDRLMSEREPDNSLPPSDKAAGQNVMEGIHRKSYSEAVIEGVRKRARVFVGDSIVRKTDRVLNKGDDVVVCLPGAKIEAITERVENIVGSGKGGSVLVHVGTNNVEREAAVPCPVDVVLVIDRSFSLDAGGYTKVKNFAKQFVSRLMLSSRGARVGVIAFNEEAEIQVEIGDYVDKTNLGQKIDSLPAPAGGTNIHKALVMLRNMFQADHRFDGQAKKQFLAVVITDGKDEDSRRVKAAADAVHAEQINVISIGFGNDIDQGQLNDMASVASYIKPTVNDLQHLVDDIEIDTCEAAVPCPVDVVLVIDRSFSLDAGGYTKVKNFAKQFVSRLMLSSRGARVGVIVFNEEAEIQVEIGDYVDKTNLEQKIDSLPAPAGGTNIHKALVMLRNMFQADHRFDGQAKKQFLAVVITDGKDEDSRRVKAAADAVHAEQINVISIGFGNDIDLGQLNDMASVASYIKPTVNDLQHLVDDIEIDTCEVDHKCDDDLLMHFDFDNGFVDVCHDAIAEKSGEGTVKLVTDTYRGKVARFAGNGYLKVPFLETWFPINEVDTFTVSLWYKILDGTGGVLVNNENSVKDAGFSLRVVGNYLLSKIRTTRGQISLMSNIQATATGWHHVAYVYDGGQLTIYVDGQVRNQAISGYLVNNDVPMYVGFENARYFFEGLMDELRIYTRALTPWEVAAL
ncbi:hypothetical protein LSAT2_008126 [Lamellibrachia satsuma]|nr:hypothetical protein LSAT2_008126 [Lamellibrachia satsuma]